MKLLFDHANAQGANLPHWINSFSLSPVANDAAIQGLLELGIKEVVLNIGQYLETANNREEARRDRGIFSSLGLDVGMDIFRRDNDRREIERADNLGARLTLMFDRRKAGIRAEAFANIARDAVEESPEEVVIKTHDGQEYRRGDLIVKRAVDLQEDGQTVRYVHAWNEMTAYYTDLQNAGILEL